VIRWLRVPGYRGRSVPAGDWGGYAA